MHSVFLYVDHAIAAGTSNFNVLNNQCLEHVVFQSNSVVCIEEATYAKLREVFLHLSCVHEWGFLFSVVLGDLDSAVSILLYQAGYRRFQNFGKRLLLQPDYVQHDTTIMHVFGR